MSRARPSHRGTAPTASFETTTARRARVAAGHDLDARLADLERAVELGEGLVSPEAMAPARAVLESADQRRRLAPGVVVVALLGATGSGKSSLLNALAGTRIARTAVTRPTTTRPLAALPAGIGPSAAGRTSALLDWLDVDERVQLTTDAGIGAATVLLDLPDIDSDEDSHRRIATRLVERVDVLVWVLDPEKYADAVIHDDFIAPMAAHAGVTVVALNQVDRLDDASRAAVMGDLGRLLAAEGLIGVSPVAVSARTGEGIQELRERIGRIAATARAAEDRLAADVRSAAESAWRNLDLDHASGARLVAGAHEQALSEAAALAAGADAVAEAVAESMRLRATAKVGWVPVRWLARFRRDPLRALHLGADILPTARRRSDSDEPQSAGRPVARTSLPQAGPAADGALRTAAHTTAARLASGLPGEAGADVVARSDGRASALAPALDRAVAHVDLEQMRSPTWWNAAAWVQWLLMLTAVVGGAWLAVLHVVRQYLLIIVEPPRWGLVPWPTVALVSGLALGALCAAAGTALARVGARRCRQRVEDRLRQAADAVVEHEVLGPLRADLERWDELVALLSGLR
ncbi:GTPase [Actinomyces massiliensis]|uniref:GTPase n=1 Tax=Actinomyces massiliensis TaxID=461393 RepID=UPI0028F16313|nr:GTPase [Actinomyces massiliensis]